MLSDTIQKARRVWKLCLIRWKKKNQRCESLYLFFNFFFSFALVIVNFERIFWNSTNLSRLENFSQKKKIGFFESFIFLIVKKNPS